MSVLLESRKVNGINIPLYFKFSTVLAKENVTGDKLLTLENWMAMFDELNPLLASTSDPNSSKKNKTFEMDSGRLSVKVRWGKINDSSDMGTHIVKILSLSSSSVGKYFLKIDVKLGSYLERIASELEQKGKSLDVKNHSKEASHDLHNSSKQKKFNHRKISDMLPKIQKDNPESPALFDETATSNVLEELNDDDLNRVEEYIPLPKPTPVNAALNTTDTLPTYTPEKYSATETNAFHSEYSPTSLKVEQSMDESQLYEPTPVTPSTATYNPEKKLSEIEMNKIKSEYAPTCTNDQQIKEEIVYKPTTRKNKSSDTEKTKKILSKELFGSSDENSSDDFDRVSSSSQKSKRKMDSSPRREKKSSKEKERSKSKKKKVYDVQSSQELQSSHESIAEVGDISIRNFMAETVDALLATYSEHEEYLTGLYDLNIKHVKRNYKPTDIPDMAALDIVSPDQFTAMVDFLEQKLVLDPEGEPHYSDIIFDLLMPEWTLAIFCKKLQCTRSDGLERLRLQHVALSNSSQL